MADAFKSGFEFGAKVGGALGDGQRKKVYGDAYAKDGWKGLGEVAGASGDMDTASQAQTQVNNAEEFGFKKAQRNLAVVGNAAKAIRSLPYEARKPRLQQMAPMLEGLGFNADQLNGFDPTDDALDNIRAQVGEFGKYNDYKTVDDVLYGVGPDGSVTALTERKPKPPVATDLGDRVVFRDPETGEVVQEMRKGAAPRAAGSGGARWRMVSDPAEMKQLGVQVPVLYDDETGNMKNAPGSGGQLAGAEQRGRIALTFPNVLQAQADLKNLEAAARTKDPKATPFGNDWGARMLEAVPWDGGTAARMAGGTDYQAYETASKNFEQSIMPIFSGSAVTESEAARFLRGNMPRFGDDPKTLEKKANNRARIINSAATILGEQPPFPEAGYWSPSSGPIASTQASEAPAAAGKSGPAGAPDFSNLPDDQFLAARPR